MANLKNHKMLYCIFFLIITGTFAPPHLNKYVFPFLPPGCGSGSGKSSIMWIYADPDPKHWQRGVGFLTRLIQVGCNDAKEQADT